MSLYEEEVKINTKSLDEGLSEDKLSENVGVNYDFNEEVMISSDEQNKLLNEMKEGTEKEVVIKNPRTKTKKRDIEYIEEDDYSSKAWSITLVLCIILGFIGFHRFYVGKAGTAILMLLTFGGFGIWVLVDLIRIIINNFTDEEGKIVKRGSLAN